MYDHYCWPKGYWYDEIFADADPVITDPSMKTDNTW
jgi:hypothetical protein